MKVTHQISFIALGLVVAFAFGLTGCDSLFDDQIRPYEGPDFIEFGQVCPPNPAARCYELDVDEDEGTVELATNLIGPHRSSSTQMRFRVVEILTEEDEAGNPVVIYETTAEEGVHYSFPSGMTYTLPANSSFGMIPVQVLESDDLDPGDTVDLVLELQGAVDGSIEAAENMKYFTLVIHGV